ncbi:hypothetical protein HZF08_21325 [Paenibacillus sp. CGMCC 1.16610]|uniref:Uncharacterized protein n=1 Tax=Paenibacillus anseongense TaxID=2682845 RepID=A0ABW9U3N0_9BACL|nr:MULTISPECIES: hypothetical protein [Paenibacillus]MBA2940829.1 hypothetical protein [Paenibacillus sp. CGMCC 1.16610]MVQ34012.1 hypothetical protein [Paenibacillus anseongense]
MKEVLIVKHAVGGRTFVHSETDALRYEVLPDGDGWRITVSTPKSAAVEELLKWKRELNVFLFQEFDNQPTRKIWFYVKEGPVEYEDGLEQLTIRAQSRIDYVPDEFDM